MANLRWRAKSWVSDDGNCCITHQYGDTYYLVVFQEVRTGERTLVTSGTFTSKAAAIREAERRTNAKGKR